MFQPTLFSMWTMCVTSTSVTVREFSNFISQSVCQTAICRYNAHIIHTDVVASHILRTRVRDWWYFMLIIRLEWNGCITSLEDLQVQR